MKVATEFATIAILVAAVLLLAFGTPRNAEPVRARAGFWWVSRN